MTNSDLSQLFFDEQTRTHLLKNLSGAWGGSFILNSFRILLLAILSGVSFRYHILILKISIKHKTDPIVALFYHFIRLCCQKYCISREWKDDYFLFFSFVSFIQQEIKVSKFLFFYFLWESDSSLMKSNESLYAPFKLSAIVVGSNCCAIRFMFFAN